MAALALANPDALAIDFHSHTDASWDGRRGFTAERNRAWHRAAGFDVAYVTDHLSAFSVDTQWQNPERAGRGTVLLPGVELACGGPHLVVLGASAGEARTRCAGMATFDLVARTTVSRPVAPAISIVTLPADLSFTDLSGSLDAVELIDGAPRALDQLERDRRALLSLAEHRRLSLVASSNNHGWGRTSAAWSVMEIPGWQTLAPVALDSAIRVRLVAGSTQGVRLVARRRVPPGNSTAVLAVTAPALAWTLLTTISFPERLAWCLWTWIAWGLMRALARRPRPNDVSSCGQE
jgi:hypothetical protein